MASVTFTLSDDLAAWIERQVESSAFPSAQAYIAAAVRQDREIRDPDHPLTHEELRDMIAEARAGGLSEKTPEEVFDEAQAHWAREQQEVA